MSLDICRHQWTSSFEPCRNQWTSSFEPCRPQWTSSFEPCRPQWTSSFAHAGIIHIITRKSKSNAKVVYSSPSLRHRRKGGRHRLTIEVETILSGYIRGYIYPRITQHNAIFGKKMQKRRQAVGSNSVRIQIRPR